MVLTWFKTVFHEGARKEIIILKVLRTVVTPRWLLWWNKYSSWGEDMRREYPAPVKYFFPSLFTFMQNLKKMLTKRSGKQLIAWKFSCTCRPENKVILHFQSSKSLINSVLSPMITILIQVNFVLEKNCWNNAQNKKQELNLLFPQPSPCCFDSSRNNSQQFVSITDFVYTCVFDP